MLAIRDDPEQDGRASLIAPPVGQQGVARTRRMVVAASSLDEDPESTAFPPDSSLPRPDVDEVFAG